MSPIRLNLRERLEVACYHAIFAKWVVNPTGPGMVCCHCGKPAPDVVLRICSECDKEFVLNRDAKWRPKMVSLSDGRLIERTVLCPPCNGVPNLVAEALSP